MRPILCVVLISIVVCGDCFGMTWETFGPARGLGRGWGEQPGWAAGLVDVLGHDSRVYSIWVNGNENYYFDARPEQVKELIDGYSKIRLRDHVIRIVEEGGQRKSRVGRLIEFTVSCMY